MWIIVAEGQVILKNGDSYRAGSELELPDADAIALIDSGQALRRDPEVGDKNLSGESAGSGGEVAEVAATGGDAVHAPDPPAPDLASGSPQAGAAPAPGETAGEVPTAPDLAESAPQAGPQQAAPPRKRGGGRKKGR